MGDGTVHAHHLAVFRPPGQHGNGGGVGVQKQIGMHRAAEARNGGSVEGDAVFESPVQFGGHDGDVLLLAKDVAKGQADEFYIVLGHILPHLVSGIFHAQAAFLRKSFFDYTAQPRLFPAPDAIFPESFTKSAIDKWAVGG